MSREFPSIAEIAALHDTLIAEFGGSPGIRDEGALISALLRPQLGFYDGLIEQAAALLESLANNHPFVDGNKRVSFAATDVFLRSNGAFINCESDATYEHFIQLFESNSFRFDQIATWLNEHVEQLPGSGQAKPKS